MKNKWKYKLKLDNFYYDDSLSIEEKGKLVATQIRKLPLDKIECRCGEDFEDVAINFEHIEGYDDVTPIEEFDNQMETLYDMAYTYDIWITTK